MFEIRIGEIGYARIRARQRIDVEVRPGIWGWLDPMSEYPNCLVRGVECEFNFYQPQPEDFRASVRKSERLESAVQEVMQCFLDFDAKPGEREVRENLCDILGEESPDGEALRAYVSRGERHEPPLTDALIRAGGGDQNR